jgi:hypothetical protein
MYLRGQHCALTLTDTARTFTRDLRMGELPFHLRAVFISSKEAVTSGRDILDWKEPSTDLNLAFDAVGFPFGLPNPT